MAQLPLVIYPDAILTRRSTDVLEIDGELYALGQAMTETMYGSHGIGLAAPQVARNIRLITVDVDQDGSPGTLMHLVNPVITESHGRTSYEEGCLSFPGLAAEVRRKKEIHVQAYDLDGGEIDLHADGLLSICIQHEIDHLNGVCFVDRLNAVKRKLVVRDYLRDQALQREDDTLDAIRALHDAHQDD
ncbi:MAG: peptide deformylase [Myxococcota bacterium]|jgi:peptide deformylase|nr:peptide deformylase [Myxococcota bacterium]